MLEFDIKKRIIIFSDGGEVKKSTVLSVTEASILAELILHFDGCSREHLLEHCWPEKIVSANSVNVAIANIRVVAKQIGLMDLIVTNRGVGYQLAQVMVLLKCKPSRVEKFSLFFKNILIEINEHHSYFIANIIFTYFIFLLIKTYCWALKL